MDKVKLVKVISERQGLPLKKAHQAFEALIDVVRDALLAKKKVTLHRLGTLHIVRRRQRTAWNPKTMIPVAVPERWAAKFMASDDLRRVLKG